MREAYRRRSVVRRFYSLSPLVLLFAPTCFPTTCEDLNAILSPVPTWAVGLDAGLWGSDPGIGVRTQFLPANSAVGLSMGLSKHFPDYGSAYRGSLGAQVSVPSGGPLNLFGVAGPVWARTGFGGDEYVPPTGEFSDFGGGAFQDLGSSSQNAFGLYMGVGAAGNNPDSKWHPFAEVGYDLFFAGAETDNQLRLSGGLTYQLGGEN